MNRKQILGLFSSIIGAVLSVIALYAMNVIGGIKGGVSAATSHAQGPFGGMVGEGVNKAASAYDTLILGSLIVGIALLVIGVGMMLYFRKKK